MRFKKIIKLFKKGNCCVFGLRGTGKDMLVGNVIARRKDPYISNLDYSGGKNLMNLDFNLLDIKNDYHNFISSHINKYDYPYLKSSDIYLSDANVYFPSQYCSDLNRKYPNFPHFMALSRQIGDTNFHFNTQNLNRVWDKIREQSDIYIRCKWCKLLFGKIVIQRIYLYDKYQSAVDRVDICRVKVPLFNKQARLNARIHLDNYHNQFGSVKKKLLIYWNRSKHDTLFFGKLLSKEVL